NLHAAAHGRRPPFRRPRASIPTMKFHTSDQRYLDARKALSDQVGPRELWSLIDHWPLYVGIGNLSRWIAILDLVRSTRSVPGHLAEFGSWRGANVMFMAKLLRI